ncbi:MAG: hypothetical protein ISN64_03195 [Rickettsia sp.]|nr:hypothetical protein [Rickettsia sp.]
MADEKQQQTTENSTTDNRPGFLSSAASLITNAGSTLFNGVSNAANRWYQSSETSANDSESSYDFTNESRSDQISSSMSESSVISSSVVDTSQIEEKFLTTIKNELNDKGWDVNTIDNYKFSAAIDGSIAKNASLMQDYLERVSKNLTSLTEVNKNSPAVKKELKNNLEFVENIAKNFHNSVLEDVRHDFFTHQKEIVTNLNNANKEKIFEQAFNNAVKKNPDLSMFLDEQLTTTSEDKKMIEDAKMNTSFLYKKKQELNNIISKNLAKLSKIGKTAWQKFSSFMKSVYDKGKNAVKYIGQKLVNFYNDVTNSISDLTKNVKQSARKLGNKMSNSSFYSNKGPQKDNNNQKPQVTT